MKKMIVLSGMLAAVLAAGSALAADKQPGPPPGEEMWDELDADGDGEVTLSEMNQHHQKMFSEADTDGNGAISKAEMHAHMEKMHAERRAEHMGDKNGDGVISRDEFEANASAHFDKLDANHDGVLSDEELAAGGGHGHHRRHGR